MAKLTSRILGAKELDRVLQKLPREIADKVLAGALTRGAQPFVKAARAAAPVRQGGGVKKLSKRSSRGRLPGWLRASIAARRDRAETGASVVVKVGVLGRAFYGMFGEFGTSRQAARPWFRPAWDSTRGAVLTAIGRTLGRGIERAAVRLAGPFAKSGLARKRRR